MDAISTFPFIHQIPERLQRCCINYVVARRTGNDALRSFALTRFSYGLRVNTNEPWGDPVSRILTAMDDLTAAELSWVTQWVPDDFSVYRTLVTHPGANSAIRLALLNQTTWGGHSKSPEVAAQLHDFLAQSYPLTVRFYDAYEPAIVGYDQDLPHVILLDELEQYHLEPGPVLDTVARLLLHWTGTNEELLGVARGILTAPE